nr:GDSL esterase/lipase At4g16230-like isoform X2 [Ziziphus jujuba var. spinosa]
MGVFLPHELHSPGLVFQILINFLVFRICFSKNVPSIFVFGDSLVDVGNNNYILSLAKANYDPNGIDFGKPSGRYTNGRTIVDIIGQELGLKDFFPPYLAPTTSGPVVLQGVNYASGGSGILNFTGKIFGGRINFDAQIDNFADTRQDIISSIGLPDTMQLFQTALFAIAIGSNDFIDSYSAPEVSTAVHMFVPPNVFVATLISKFRIQLTRLYNLGARRIIVANVGPVGCIPFVRDLNPDAGDNCVEFINDAIQQFNNQVKCLINELSTTLEGSTFVYADVYSIVEDILQNYESYDSACCHVAGRFGGLIPCGPTSMVCSDRSKYVFWDPFHPTEAANTIIARRILNGDANDISPINVQKLIQI